MSTQTAWSQIEWLHNQQLSLIPVRDKEDANNLPKTPYRGWKQHQQSMIDLPELWQQLEKFKTEAVAIIAGKVSGDLEIIDIDVKYKPGIDAVILSDLNKFYPDLFASLRIHKTPSGGYHLLYRVKDGVVPGNLKLSGRKKTESELLEFPKPATVNFIETRGEGGYAVAPPSMGYSVLQDQPIPLISWEERCSIINLCKSYSELIEIEKPPKTNKQQVDYYDEDPFSHFNKSPAGEDILINNGWKEHKHNNNFVWYTRPGKDKGISASFNKQKRIYYIFTASTDLEENKGYNPATLLTIFDHNSDFKASYRWLVQNGYGKIKYNIERKLIKQSAQAGRPLPPNASKAARVDYDTEVVTIQTTYPYGVFWEWDTDSESYKINREKLYTVSEGLGWRYYNQTPVKIDGYIVKKMQERDYFDSIKMYIKEEDADTYINICNSYEAFIQKNGAFSITRLPLLDEGKIIKDTVNTSYKFYQNGYLFITSELYSFNTYDTLTGLIWYDYILPRMFYEGDESGRFVDFIKLATPYNEAEKYIRKCIGYLAHQYKDETTGYIIVLTESCPDPKQGGGSGKNLFCNLLRYTTTYKSVPGSQVRYDEKFMQSWTGERIFAVSDAPKKFEFGFLKELSTGEGILKKLFKDEITVSVINMPKFIIQTNFSYEVSDGGLKRRIIPVEFTDFFTKCGGVDIHFGCLFPIGWELKDWTGYDNFIAGCIKDWLAGNLKLKPLALTEGGWKKQFEQSWGSVISSIIYEYIDTWLSKDFIKNDDFNKDLDTFYRDNNTPNSYKPALNKIYGAITEYCNHNSILFENNVLSRVDGFTVKGKRFTKLEAAPF